MINVDNMAYITNTLLVVAVVLCYVNADQCTSRGGQCKKTTSGFWFWKKSRCENGRFIRNLCRGPTDIKCCVPNTRTTTSRPTNTISYNCYGDFMKLNPAGASSATSSQDGLSYSGVRASNKMVETDFAELNKRKQCYIRAGNNHCIHPAVIAAVASRETRGGKLLYRTNGWGDGERAWGILQCDLFTSGLGNACTRYGWDSCDHINQMTEAVLLKYIRIIRSDHPNWASEYHIKGGVAAYNVGTGNVRTIARMDVGTTGDDYSNDVIARAQHLVTKYRW